MKRLRSIRQSTSLVNIDLPTGSFSLSAACCSDPKPSCRHADYFESTWPEATRVVDPSADESSPQAMLGWGTSRCPAPQVVCHCTSACLVLKNMTRRVCRHSPQVQCVSPWIPSYCRESSPSSWVLRSQGRIIVYARYFQRCVAPLMTRVVSFFAEPSRYRLPGTSCIVRTYSHHGNPCCTGTEY
jgi:hypothetical protein